MAERILVTGGAGFIGLHLARRLADEGASVTLLDDLSRGRVDDDLLALTGGNVQLIRHDLTTPIPSDLLPDPVDVVYHLAGVVGVKRTADDPAGTLQTAILGTARLLDWCDRTPPTAVFLSSTSEVGDGAVGAGLCPYPVPEDVPFVLAEPWLARTSYALGKMAAETMLMHRRDRYRVRIGRLHNVYGPRMGNAHVIPQLIERILDQTEPLPLYGAYQSRAFCYVSDAVEAAIGVVRVETDAPLVVNIGNDQEELQIMELARRLFVLAGTHPEPEIAILDPPAGSPARRRPDLGRLRALTGYVPRIDLDEGLRRTFAWYSARHPRLRPRTRSRTRLPG